VRFKPNAEKKEKQYECLDTLKGNESVYPGERVTKTLVIECPFFKIIFILFLFIFLMNFTVYAYGVFTRIFFPSSKNTSDSHFENNLSVVGNENF